MTDAIEPTLTNAPHLAELVDLEDIKALVSLQKEAQLAETQARLALAQVEIQKLLMQKKYKLGDSDQIDPTTGKITRL